MNAWAVGHLMGGLLLCVGGAQVLPLLVALGWQDASAPGLAASVGVILAAGGVLYMCCRTRRQVTFTLCEALASVGLCWIAAGCAGALPYWFCGVLNPVDALFESVSGFTTTGASVIADVEALPYGLLLWRSLTQWLGGMGIIVLSLAVLPHLGIGGMQLYRAEVPGPTPDKLTPWVRDTAKILWVVYGVLTAVLILLLYVTGMTFFDAVNHGLTTLSTGGFSTRNTSLINYPAVAQWLIIVFMALGGINFSLHFRALHGDWRAYGQNEECRAFCWIFVICTLIVCVILVDRGTVSLHSLADLEYLVRTALFQILSLMTTTGFASADFELWPVGTIPVLLLVMFIGGCAGSTSGGCKVMRITILGRMLYRDLFMLLHPRAVRKVVFQEQSLDETAMSGVVGFFLVYVVLLFALTFAVMLFDVDLTTAFSSVLTSLSNVGPGFGGVGPVDNFGWLPDTVKFLLTFAMLLGRLECYALLILLLPAFWRR